MKIDEILKLVNAGYSKDEIAAFDVTTDKKTEQKKEQKTEQKSEGFDYEKFAEALVKAQQVANGKQNFAGSQSNTEIGKFF